MMNEKHKHYYTFKILMQLMSSYYGTIYTFISALLNYAKFNKARYALKQCTIYVTRRFLSLLACDCIFHPVFASLLYHFKKRVGVCISIFPGFECISLCDEKYEWKTICYVYFYNTMLLTWLFLLLKYKYAISL